MTCQYFTPGRGGSVIQNVTFVRHCQLTNSCLEHHPDVARDLGALSEVLGNTNRPFEAEVLLGRALAISEHVHGPTHPESIKYINNLAKILRSTNRLVESQAFYWRALMLALHSFEDGHPRLSVQLTNLASILTYRGQLALAEPLLRHALRMHERHAQIEHTSIAAVLDNLTGVLRRSGRISEAELAGRRVVRVFALFRDSSGFDHPQAQYSLRQYVDVLRELGHDDEEIRRRVTAAAKQPLEPLSPELDRSREGQIRE